jgi:hypothetical protein
MPSFYPTHPEPGDPPGLYGDVYFDGQNVTGRVTDPALRVENRAGEWFVPAATGEVESATPSTVALASDTAIAPPADTAVGMVIVPAAAGPLEQIEAALSAVRDLSTQVVDFDGLTDNQIEALHEKNAELHRLSGLQLAISTDQIVHRSDPELASKGMARLSGHRTPIEMAKNVGGLTQQEVMAFASSGQMLREAQSTAPDLDDLDAPIVLRPAPPLAAPEPWLREVGAALSEHRINVAQAAAIRTGLGTPTEGVPVEILTAAAIELATAGQHLTPERMRHVARQTRDRLDREGVPLREAERRARRSAKLFTRADGMVELRWIMDPEEGMALQTLVDRSISPKVGGPRTGNPELHRTIQDDPRRPDQILADNLGHFVHLGATVDPSQLLGTPTASIVVLTQRLPKEESDGAAPSDTIPAPREDGLPDVNDPDVEHFDTGQYDIGWIHGHPDPVSPHTIDRMRCTGTVTEATISDDGSPLDISREQRLFGRKQKIALGAQFGGCTWGDKFGTPICDRPPSWTEAHHIEHWYRDKGKTVMSNGILLCKAHHLQLHNDGWEILRKHGEYWLIPPDKVDPTRTPRPMRKRSQAYLDLMTNHPPA